MSERMIELQRAKLGLPPAGSSPSAAMHNTNRSPGKGNLLRPQAAAVPKTPEEVAEAEVLSEDAQIQRFIHRLQRRDDLHPMADASSGPTVPTALSRRMLQRQGVGYLDDTVAAAISASADRFLATVLQQAVACRDQRLKGAEMARDAARHRKRHMQHYEADSDDRKRRREEAEDSWEAAHIRTISAADALKKGGGASKAADDKKKKKKKKEDDTPATNGTTPASGANVPQNDDDESYDSIDEEEDYYKEKLGDAPAPQKGDDDEDDGTLLLKDLVRPLEAWDFHVTGKEALEDKDHDSDEEDPEAEDDDREESSTAPTEDNGNDDGASVAGWEGQKSDTKSGEGGDPEPKQKTSSSPTPKASA